MPPRKTRSSNPKKAPLTPKNDRDDHDQSDPHPQECEEPPGPSRKKAQTSNPAPPSEFHENEEDEGSSLIDENETESPKKARKKEYTNAERIERNAPSGKEEPNRLLRLHGHNEVKWVEVWGWDNTGVVGFPGLKEDLCMAKLEPNLEGFEDKLLDVADFVGSSYQVSTVGLTVRVVAKRKADVVRMSQNQVCTIAKFLVADDSGMALLTLFNEAVQTIHMALDVGSVLRIPPKCCMMRKTAKNEKDEKFTVFYDKLLPLEMKVDKYKTRRLAYLSSKEGLGKLPRFLYDERKLTLVGREEFEKNLEEVGFLDIAGVVSFAGRLERTELDKAGIETSEGVECVRLFKVYRWIGLIGPDQEEKMLQLLVTQETLHEQEGILPGSVLVISNCKVWNGTIYSTEWSKVLKNSFTDLMRLYPASYFSEAVTKLGSVQSYRNIISSYNKFSIGGTFLRKADSKEDLLLIYNEGKKVVKKVPEDFKFARRERLSLVVRAKITSALEILEEGSMYHVLPTNKGDKWYRERPNRWLYGTGEEVRGKKPLFRHPLTCYCSACNLRYWFNRTRKVELDRLLDTSSCSKIVRWKDVIDEVLKNMEGMDGPLLTPSKYSLDFPEKLPPLGELPLLRTFPHFRVTLLDCASEAAYVCEWTNAPAKEMEERLRIAQDRDVIACIVICKAGDGCVKGETRLEVYLEDFVVVDTDAEEDNGSEVSENERESEVLGNCL